MGFQIPAGGLVVTLGGDGTPDIEVTPLVRLDLWPTWLETGCFHAEKARAAGERLNPDLTDDEKYKALTEELQSGLVALTAFAFAVDGFYDTLRQELGDHPYQAMWMKNRTARHSQVTETLRFHLNLGPKFSDQLRTVITQLFDFRSRAVHPNGKFVEPIYRPEIDSGVHPHLITFSGPHAVQSRALVLELLDRLIARATEKSNPEADLGWLTRGRAEVDRLSETYRIAGDDQHAFSQ